jgi:hypothetical protein
MADAELAWRLQQELDAEGSPRLGDKLIAMRALSLSRDSLYRPGSSLQGIT